jgi:membrane protease YdiL (CAAX protease family)
MNSSTYAQVTQIRVPFSVSFVITLLMGGIYTWLDTCQPVEPFYSILAFLPGGISLLALRASGISWAELYLRYARISKPGLMVLGLTTTILLPILGSNSAWIGWDWLPALVYAPASGIAQELYFRSSLLPGFEKLFGHRRAVALVFHAIIFIAFHYRTYQVLPSLPIALLVTAVLFLAGCGWGWQVQRDRTVVWAILQHSLFLMLMSMFAWG